MVADLVIGKSKSNPEYIVKQPTRKEEVGTDLNPQARTPYLVIRDYKVNGNENHFPLSTVFLIQDRGTCLSSEESSTWLSRARMIKVLPPIGIPTILSRPMVCLRWLATRKSGSTFSNKGKRAARSVYVTNKPRKILWFLPVTVKVVACLSMWGASKHGSTVK